MITRTNARIEDGKLYLEAEVIPTITQDDDRRLVFIGRMMSYATQAQQEVFAMTDSTVLLEADKIVRRMQANS